MSDESSGSESGSNEATSSEEEEEEEETFNIYLKMFGSRFKIKEKHHPNKLNKNLKISQLKCLIQFTKDIYNKNIELIYKNNIMENNKILNDYGIKSDDHEINVKIIDNNNKNIQINDNCLILLKKEENACKTLFNIIKQKEQFINIFQESIKDKDYYSKLMKSEVEIQKKLLTRIITITCTKMKSKIKTNSKKVFYNVKNTDPKYLKELQNKFNKEVNIINKAKNACIQLLTIKKEKDRNELYKIKNIEDIILEENLAQYSDDENNSDNDDEKDVPVTIDDILDDVMDKIDKDIENIVNQIFAGAMYIDLDYFNFRQHLKNTWKVTGLVTKEKESVMVEEPVSKPQKISIRSCKILFQTYRASSQPIMGYIPWNLKKLNNCQSALVDQSQNLTEFIIKRDGWYRVTSRHCVPINSGATSHLYVNNTIIASCDRMMSSGTYDVSFVFNEILELKKGDKIKIYQSKQTYKTESNTNYFGIETIPNGILDKFLVSSTTTTDSYRNWQITIKDIPNDYMYWYDSKKQCKFKKQGFYRIVCRSHSSYSGGSKYMYMEHYHDGANRIAYNYKASPTTGKLCHNFDQMIFATRKDHIRFYCAYSYVAAQTANRLSVEYCPFDDNISVWKSRGHSSYKQQWNVPQWTSDIYEVSDDETTIKFTQDGIYRISFTLHGYGSSVNSYATVYLNNQPIAQCREGCYSGSYYHGMSLTELIQVKKNDVLYIYNYPGYASKDYQYLYLEKIIC